MSCSCACVCVAFAIKTHFSFNALSLTPVLTLCYVLHVLSQSFSVFFHTPIRGNVLLGTLQNCGIYFDTWSGSSCFLAILLCRLSFSWRWGWGFFSVLFSPSYLLLYSVLQAYAALLALLVMIFLSSQDTRNKKFWIAFELAVSPGGDSCTEKSQNMGLFCKPLET